MKTINGVDYWNKNDFQEKLDSFTGKKTDRLRTFRRIVANNRKRIIYDNDDGMVYIDSRIVRNQKKYISPYYNKIDLGIRKTTDTRKYLCISDFARITGKSQTTIRKYVSRLKKYIFIDEYYFKTLLIRTDDQNHIELHRTLIQDFIGEELMEKELQLLFENPERRTKQMIEFLSNLKWTHFCSIRYKAIQNRYQCLKQFDRLFHLLLKNKFSDVALFGVVEKNPDGVGYHYHFLIHADSLLELESYLNRYYWQYVDDISSDIQKYDCSQKALEYISNKIDWKKDSYYLNYSDKNIFSNEKYLKNKKTIK